MISHFASSLLRSCMNGIIMTENNTHLDGFHRGRVGLFHAMHGIGKEENCPARDDLTHAQQEREEPAAVVCTATQRVFFLVFLIIYL